MTKTVVGLMDTPQDAQKVLQDLDSAGFSRGDISIMAEEEPSRGLRGAEQLKRIKGTETGVGTVPGGAVGELTRLGMPEADAVNYAEGVKRGGFLVCVSADDDNAHEAAEIMRRDGAVDIDRRAGEWTGRKAGLEEPRTGASFTEKQGREGVIPVIEEEVEIGKRQVLKGSVRVYSHVKEIPVEEQVRLTEERAKVERRPVDRPVTDAERAAFKEQSFEIRETAEEPVISKQARVKEEVVLGKESVERTERIHDTVRRTEVEVEQGGESRFGQQREFAGEDTEFMNHFSSNYATKGERFDAYRSAYHYAEGRSSDPRMQGKDWPDVEEDIHQDWEKSHPGTWARFKDAIHYGWNKTRRH